MDKPLYIQYLEEKLEFTEKLLTYIVGTYNRGTTLPVFPTYQEWKEKDFGVKNDYR